MRYSLIVLLMFAVGNIHAQPINSISQVELSHSGGTDKCGCHYNRKTGKYHCHTRKQRGGSCPP
ncbi:YHYH domain-containing protein [Vibrio parahaemolyticus]|nr:YHYH domain-containing protein [Vibrio parahaemolyticus]MCC3798436.1 YHYH domain-containing protein [Vibrio parahaemolyticus]MCC3813180.1 YHYH domain-containing protein [Vibrio parahaemolyticus]